MICSEFMMSTLLFKALESSMHSVALVCLLMVLVGICLINFEMLCIRLHTILPILVPNIFLYGNLQKWLCAFYDHTNLYSFISTIYCLVLGAIFESQFFNCRRTVNVK